MALFIIGDTHLSQGVDKPMDIFGGNWENYTQKLCDNWNKTVTDDDTVVIAGDVSWGMSLKEALADFKLIESLPGKKLIVKGNHDYWWDTVTKMKRFLTENGITTIDFIYNSAVSVDGISICGTRGWMLESMSARDEDKKIIAREAGRLCRSLECANAGDERVVVMHYPPVYDSNVAQEFIDIMHRFGVKRCYYGHLHSASIKKADVGELFGINFYLVSADSIDFFPINM